MLYVSWADLTAIQKLFLTLLILNCIGIFVGVFTLLAKLIVEIKVYRKTVVNVEVAKESMQLTSKLYQEISRKAGEITHTAKEMKEVVKESVVLK